MTCKNVCDVCPSTPRTPVRQLLVLPVLAGAAPAALARSAWNGLSRAVHHHAYELPATAAELRGWHREVAALLVLLEPPEAV